MSLVILIKSEMPGLVLFNAWVGTLSLNHDRKHWYSGPFYPIY